MNSTTTCTYGGEEYAIGYGPAGDGNFGSYIILHPGKFDSSALSVPSGGTRPLAVGAPGFATSTCVTTSSGSSGGSSTSCGTSTSSPCYNQDTHGNIIAGIEIAFAVMFFVVWVIRKI